MEWYPPASFYFEMKLSGSGHTNDAIFMEVSGLEKPVISPLPEEGGSPIAHIVPQRVVYENITLKRGLLKNSEITKWCEDAFVNGKIVLKDIQISLLDEKGTPLASWLIKNAFPIKWSVSKANTSGDEITVEHLEISFEYFTKTL
ncbi:MAG: phage tail protein [Bacteroidia bacterium]